MIAKSTTVNFNDMQVKALERYGERKNCNTTQAVLSAIVNDLPDFKELEAESLASGNSTQSLSDNSEDTGTG